MDLLGGRTHEPLQALCSVLLSSKALGSKLPRDKGRAVSKGEQKRRGNRPGREQRREPKD